MREPGRTLAEMLSDHQLEERGDMGRQEYMGQHDMSSYTSESDAAGWRGEYACHRTVGKEEMEI